MIARVHRYEIEVSSDYGRDLSAECEAAGDALLAALAALPDAGVAACAVASRLISAGSAGLRLDDGAGGEWPADDGEEAAWRQWCACELAALRAAYAGWAQWPRSGGVCVGLPRRGWAST